jgi:hypothetical protein
MDSATFIIPNAFRHLTEMSDEKMMAMYDAGLIDVDAIKFLLLVRKGRYAYLSPQQADRMEAIECAVMQYDAVHGNTLSDDEIGGMIKVLNGPPRSTWRVWRPRTFNE